MAGSFEEVGILRLRHRLSTNRQIAPLDCVLKNTKNYQEVMRKVLKNTDQLSSSGQTLPLDFVLKKIQKNT